MGLITKTVKINLSGITIKHYESLGYRIPKRKASESFYKRYKRELVYDLDKKIEVNVKDLPNKSMVMVKIKCDCCEKEYEISYQVYKRYVHENDKYYCNNCCSKVFNSGENNPSWDKNKTEEERIKGRINNELKMFVKKVMKRDNYICQCCNKEINHDGVVHHLDGYNWCKEKRTDETNGITLCETCHKNFHSIYGYGNNTKEQFEEWIGYAIGELERYEGELPTTRKIYCIEENKIYESAKDVMVAYGLKSNEHIYDMCNRTYKNRKYSNGRVIKQYYKSVKGKHLLWYDEYLKMTKEDVENFLIWCKTKQPNN